MEQDEAYQRLKWRGIRTTQEKKNEAEAKTIVNRFKQKSISLPRIDDKKRWAGYPGLTGHAPKIARNYIPDCKYFVEPLAGTAKVYQEILKLKDKKIENYILNDKSIFIYKWLKREFPNATVTMQDFVDCVNLYDSTETVFLFDPPYYPSYYDQDFSCFDRESTKTYYRQIIELCKTLQGKFIIAGRKENTILKKSGFKIRYIKSEYVVSGHYPKLLIATNIKI